MKAIKAISAALISLMTLSAVHAQEVVVKTKTQPYYGKKKVAVTEHKHRYHSPYGYSKSEVIVNKHYSGHRAYYYDKGTRRYYKVTEGRRVYYHHGWTPSY